MSRPLRPPAALAPYVPSAADPWDADKARHLIRRTGLGVRRADVEAVLALSPADAVAEVVGRAASRAPYAEPSWLSIRRPPSDAPQSEKDAYDDANGDGLREVYRGAYDRLMGGAQPAVLDRLAVALRERLTVFWSSHFVTEYRTHNVATWLWRFRAILDRHALGDFRQAVRDVGVTPAMLSYLNGDQNRSGRPNENYARELFELFTMGPDGPDGAPNYTQADVTEAARALTGWRTDRRAEVDAYFDASRFDAGDKTILGRTGPWGTDDVPTILFEERAPQIAAFVARALHREFVSEEPDADAEAALADLLLDADFQIGPVVEALFASALFFGEAARAAVIKSPLEGLLGAVYAFGVDRLDDDSWGRYRWLSSTLNQDLVNPPDVFGWRDGRAWIDTSTLTERARRARDEVWRRSAALYADAKARPSAYVARDLVADLAADHLARIPTDAELDDLTEVLLAGTPAYAWDPTASGADKRVRGLMQHLVSLPEYQLR